MSIKPLGLVLIFACLFGVVGYSFGLAAYFLLIAPYHGEVEFSRIQAGFFYDVYPAFLVWLGGCVGYLIASNKSDRQRYLRNAWIYLAAALVVALLCALTFNHSLWRFGVIIYVGINLILIPLLMAAASVVVVRLKI